jgi:hypothetical protein
MYTYRNSFHWTEARSRYSKEGLYDAYERCHGGTSYASDDDYNKLRVIRRISSALCGIAGCTCGDWLGERK